MSPTQRTLRLLRERGLRAAVVERWLPCGVRQDLFNIIDVIALDPNRGVIGIQVAGNCFADRYRKLTIERAEETRAWLSTPGTRLEIWAWRKISRGRKRPGWEPRIYVLTIEDLHSP